MILHIYIVQNHGRMTNEVHKNVLSISDGIYIITTVTKL